MGLQYWASILALATLIKANETEDIYQGPTPGEHTNESAQIVWIIGSAAVLFFLIMTSVIKCLCGKKTPKKVGTAPVEKQAGANQVIDDVDEEAKANDSKTESGPAILIDSGRLEDEEANLKTAAQRQTQDTFKAK